MDVVDLGIDADMVVVDNVVGISVMDDTVAQVSVADVVALAVEVEATDVAFDVVGHRLADIVMVCSEASWLLLP